MVVFGLLAFDNALAILQTFPELFPQVSSTPSPLLAMKALMMPYDGYNEDALVGLSQASERLQSKSRSFHLASSAFSGPVRVDLIKL